MNRRRAAIELLVFAILVEIDLWWLRGLAWLGWSAIAQVALIGLVVVSWRRRRRDSVSERSRGGLWSAWGRVAAYTLVAAGVIAVAGEAARTEPFDEIRLFQLSSPLWDQLRLLADEIGRATLQQVLLLGFLAPVSREILRRRMPSALLAAAIFGFAHLPNPILVTGTFLLGWMWIHLYRRGAAIAAIIVSHMLLAGLAFAIFPERTLTELKVGAEAVAREPRYTVFEDEATRRVLRRVCSGSVRGSDDVFAVLEEFLDRPLTAWEREHWQLRRDQLSPCSATKKLLMNAPAHGGSHTGRSAGDGG